MSRAKQFAGLVFAVAMLGVGLAVPANASPAQAQTPAGATQVVTGHGGGDWKGGDDWRWGNRHRCWVWRHGHWQYKWWDRWCRWHGGGHGGGGHGPWGGGHGGK